MSSKLPILRARVVIRTLLKAGFYIHHQTGSHVQLKHDDKPDLRVTVPSHQGFDLQKPIIRSIINQAGLTVEEFTDLL